MPKLKAFTLFSFSIIFLLTSIPSAFAEEKITLNTYYPAPIAEYCDLEAEKSFTAGEEGTTSDPFTNITPFYGDVSILPQNRDVWAGLEGGNVGIGTDVPETKLEVVGGIIKATGGLIIETRTSTPTSLVAGQLWLRMDVIPSTWNIETVDWEGTVGYEPSLAIDSNDNVHIGYQRYSVGFKYATNVSGSWVTEFVDSGGEHPSITIDSNNNVHASYEGPPQGGNPLPLCYARRSFSSGLWNTETVILEGYVGTYSSIAVDSANRVWISYFDHNYTDLEYATGYFGSWSTGVIASGSAWLGQPNSTAIDSNNKVHVSYFRNGAPFGHISYLIYKTNASGSWVTQVSTPSGYYNSIAIDSNDNVHISYFKWPSLKYITNASGSWVIETITDGGQFNSIAIDSNNKVHISHYRSAKLKYTTNASGSWVTETVTDCGQQYTSIGIDSNDNAHISFYDDINRDLMYASQASFTDIGLRAYNGTEVITIACEPETAVSSALRIGKDSKVYGIALVDPTDPDATSIRIKTFSGVKALREF